MVPSHVRPRRIQRTRRGSHSLMMSLILSPATEPPVARIPGKRWIRGVDLWTWKRKERRYREFVEVSPVGTDASRRIIPGIPIDVIFRFLRRSFKNTKIIDFVNYCTARSTSSVYPEIICRSVEQYGEILSQRPLTILLCVVHLVAAIVFISISIVVDIARFYKNASVILQRW